MSRVLLLGGSGTAGRATAEALVAAGHDVTAVVRPGSSGKAVLPEAVELRFADVTDPEAFRRDGVRGDRFDALVSCLASRSGAPADARAVDHRAHSAALAVAREAGVGHMVYLSAICVQKPLLAFQEAKLAFEAELKASGLRWSVVRPTAFFKSLSGQIDRVRDGKPFLVFGDGRLTACKPISDRDLGRYIAGCLVEEDRWNRVLPIGGPGPALTPLDQGRLLFGALGREPTFRHVPVAMLDAIIGGLSVAGRISPKLRDKAELARIGRYYATESMLVWDPAAGRYDADATPSFGEDTLEAHYRAVIRGDVSVDLGEHAVF